MKESNIKDPKHFSSANREGNTTMLVTPTNMIKNYRLTGLLNLLVFATCTVGSAWATNCPTENIRWAHSSQRIYVFGPVECTLTEIDQAISSAPLDLVDPEARIWFLGANLFIEEGATVLLHGSEIGGDVDELRIKSNNSSDPYNFAFIRAQWGNLQIKNTRITSWDEAVNGPDTEYEKLGRAFIHVRSYLEAGIARESRMDVIESEVAYLGYYAPRSEVQHQEITGESYGLVWKVQERDLLQVDVHGDIGNSTIHHNYLGMSSYGASGMHIVNSEFYENVQYGLDPHNDSDDLVIEGNNVHHNGKHGIICAKRCDNLLIRYNRSSYNAGHGIALHQSVVDSVIAGNEVVGNLEAGIALFESHNNIVRDNVVDGNKWGIRLREGSRNNVVENNRVYNQALHGLYFYSGNEYNTVSGNQLSNNGACGAKLIGSYNSAQNNIVNSNKCGFQLGDSSVTAQSSIISDKVFPALCLPLQ
jgi:parallel beta-helix repeat protein